MWVTGSSNNYGLWSDAEYDAIIAECTTGSLAADLPARWEAMRQADQIIMDQAVILPVYQKSNAMMIKANVKDIEMHSIALNRVYKNTTIE